MYNLASTVWLYDFLTGNFVVFSSIIYNVVIGRRMHWRW